MAFPIFKLPIIVIMTVLNSMRIKDLNKLSRTSIRVKGMVEDAMRPRQIALLKAPLLIGVEILRSMGFVDLYVLSRTSKLMKIIVQQEIRVRNYSLSLSIQPTGFLFQFTHMGPEKIEESTISVKPSVKEIDNYYEGTGKISVQGQQSHLVTYYKSPFGGAKRMYMEITEIFRIPVGKIYIDLKVIENGYKPIINWINEISSEVPFVHIFGENCSFEAYSWVFDNLRPTQEVHFFSKPAEFSVKEAHPITHKNLLIKYGEWVTVEHLKAMESSSIYIKNSTITDDHINEFLHGLVSGSNPNLRKLVIGLARDLDPDQIDEHEWRIQLENGMECTAQYVYYEEDEQLGIEIDIGEKGFQTS